MAAALLPETAPRLLTPDTLRTAAKQSQGLHLVPLSLRRAIKGYLRGNGPRPLFLAHHLLDGLLAPPYH
jgi:hypothetical protein